MATKSSGGKEMPGAGGELDGAFGATAAATAAWLGASHYLTET